MKLPIDVIQVASDIGGPARGAALGPQALRLAGLAQRVMGAEWRPELRVDEAAWRGAERAPSRGADDANPLDALPESTTNAVAALCAKLAAETARSVGAGRFPLVLGGDHACAAGTWRGVSRAAEANGRIGLLWIDAHMDSHTPATSETGNLHGMPLAALLGHGDPRLAGERPALSPRHVCLIGVRSFEAGEAALLDRLGVRVFGMREIERRGFAAVLADGLEIVREAEGGFGLSLDVDALDPRDAPGVTVPEAQGIRAADLLAACVRIGEEPGLLGAEFVEYNPLADHAGQTARLVVELVVTLLDAANRGAWRKPACANR
jgi:arginase